MNWGSVSTLNELGFRLNVKGVGPIIVTLRSLERQTVTILGPTPLTHGDCERRATHWRRAQTFEVERRGLAAEAERRSRQACHRGAVAERNDADDPTHLPEAPHGQLEEPAKQGEAKGKMTKVQFDPYYITIT